MALAELVQSGMHWAGRKFKEGITTAYAIGLLSFGSGCTEEQENFCVQETDCAETETCENSQCVPLNCHVDTDCSLEEICQDSRCTIPSGGTIQLAPETRIPENYASFRSVVVEQEQLRFVFSVPATEVDIEAGHVVLGAAEGGYIRRIEWVEYEGDTLITHTSPASLAEAIQQGRIEGTIQMNPGSSSKSSSPYTTRAAALGWGIDLDNTLLYEGTISGQQLQVRITQGGISFTPELHFDAEIDWFEISRLSVSVSGEVDLGLDVQATVSGNLEAAWEGPLLPQYVHPFAFSIGPLPVAGTVTFNLEGGFEMQATTAGEFSTGFACNAFVEVGARYQRGSGWSDIWNPELNCEGHSPQLNLEGTTALRAHVRPELGLNLYGVAGPTLDIEPYLSWDSYFSLSNWNWVLLAGLAGHLGFQLEVFSFELARYYKELFDWNVSIARDSSDGSCSDTCSPPEGTRCNGDSVERCIDADGDGCREWSLHWECATSCSGGSCTSGGGGGCTDSYEPNNSLGQAASIGAGNYNGLRICSGDEDWFRILVNAGQQLTATIHFTNSNGDLDMRLLDGSGAVLDNSNGTSDSERVQSTASSNESFIMHVYGFNGAQNTYTMQVSLGGGTSCTDDCSVIGRYCSGNDVFECYRDTDGCLKTQRMGTCDTSCVDGACETPAGERFVDAGNGTIRDNDTGFYWQRVPQTNVTWAEANDYCNALRLGERDNWRLADYSDLVTIMDFTAECYIHPSFEGNCGLYWAGDTNGGWETCNGTSERPAASFNGVSSSYNCQPVSLRLNVRCKSD